MNPLCKGGSPEAINCPLGEVAIGARPTGAKLLILIYGIEITQMSSMSSVQIQALVRNMDESMRKHKRLKTGNPSEWRRKLMEENKKLYDEFPGIFDMHMDGQLDETFFYMLQMRHKIEKGEVTEDQASIAVGQKLFNRYVAPVVENQPAPPTLSYEQYYKQYASETANQNGNI